MPVYFPPLLPPTTGEEGTLIVAQRVFAQRPDLTALRTGAMQAFLSLNSGGGGGGSAPDDAEVIIATQVFGP
jgi:hypothetical protein